MPKKLLILIISASLIITGCISFTQKQVGIKGVFRSVDSGENWVSKNVFLHSGGTGTIAGLDVISMIFDPQDNQAIYINSVNGGLVYSYDNGESWMKAPGLDGRIESVAIDPKNKCVIYVASANTVKKSVDCNRTWSEVYIDTRADKLVTALGIDHFNNTIIYTGNTAGDILKSFDGGVKWQVIERLDDKIVKILINPNDSRIIYVATNRKGIFKSTDSGATWVDISDGLKPYSGALEYHNLIFDLSQENSLLLVAKYGLLKSNDGGLTWEPFNLITPPTTTDIFAVAINPKNNREIYYATASTFYKTVDGGQNWITKRLPSVALPATLLISPQNPNVVYLGFTSPAK